MVGERASTLRLRTRLALRPHRSLNLFTLNHAQASLHSTHMARRVNIKIVRHGETNENRAKIIQGHVDTLLNAEGEAQARVTAAYFKTATHFDQIWVSDLKRAYKVRQWKRVAYRATTCNERGGLRIATTEPR